MKKVIAYISGKTEDELKEIQKYCVSKDYEIEEVYEEDPEEIFAFNKGKKIIITELSVLSDDIKKIYDYVVYAEDYCFCCFETIKNGLNYDFDIKLIEGENPCV